MARHGVVWSGMCVGRTQVGVLQAVGLGLLLALNTVLPSWRLLQCAGLHGLACSVAGVKGTKQECMLMLCAVLSVLGLRACSVPLAGFG